MTAASLRERLAVSRKRLVVVDLDERLQWLDREILRLVTERDRLLLVKETT